MPGARADEALPRTGLSGSPPRIATVYQDHAYGELQPCEMSTVRWLRMSEALARAGFQVDMILDAAVTPETDAPGLRFVPPAEADWDRYDVVKTLFHRGFDLLEALGGAEHPFIISKLGSVVGPEDGTPGVFFTGEVRERLYRTQSRLAQRSRYVVVLTEASRRLWVSCSGDASRVLLVPTGVDARIPPPGRDPYAGIDGPVALYLGTIYGDSQREVNRYWQRRLNGIGRRLRRRGIRLCLAGKGFTDLLDPEAVTYLGAIGHDRTWDYQYFADAGLVLAQGAVQDNESSKLYQYLRSGLPAVSERPVPNHGLIAETGLGTVADFEDDATFAELVEQAISREWDRARAVRHMLEHHTWDCRAALYRDLILRELSADRTVAPSGRPAPGS